MKYSDWAKLVSGLMDDTPLGRIVQIRSEKDKEILKNYTPEQRRIRAEWASFRGSRCPSMSKEDARVQMAQLERTIASMFGEKR